MITRLDDRSLAWFRRALCFCWGWTLIVRLSDLRSHYTDEGVLPRDLLENLPWKFSLNMLSGTAEFQAAVFGLSFVAAILCFFNYRPVLSASVMWLTAISIFSRNELVMNGADHYFAMLMSWNILLCAPHFRSAASAGYTAQIALLYFFTGVCKLHFTPWLDGTAMRDVLGLDILTRPWSQSLTAHAGLMSAMTYLTVAVEMLAPAGILLGLRFAKVRAITLVVLAGMHIGIVILLKLYFIPVASLVSLIPFIPAEWWKRTSERINLKPGGPAAFVAIYVIIILLANVYALPSRPLKVSDSFMSPIRAFRLEQDWAFYAPPPSAGFDGWWVAEGTTGSGESVDVWNQKSSSPAIAKPAVLSDHYANQHWTAYFINGADLSVRPLVQGLLPYLCREWAADATHARLSEVKLHRYTSINDGEPILQFTLSGVCPNL